MNIKKMTTLLVLLGCGLATTIISCNGDGVADTPSVPTHGVKTPHLQADGCNSTLAIDRCAVGAASAEYNPETGALSVTNSNDLLSGVKSSFLDAYSWHNQISSKLPASPGEQISAVAYNNDARQARLDVSQDQLDNSRTSISPTFDAGSGKYRVEVYNDGAKIATQENVLPGSTTYAKIIIDVWIHWGFQVIHVHIEIGAQQNKGAHVNATNELVDAGACEWVVGGPSENAVEVTLPDGTIANGDEIRFIEEVDGATRYPYQSVNRIDVLSNVGSFDVLGESAAN